MVPEARLELARLERRGILNPLCLPIPPLGQIGAGNEARTRDPDLGKVVLYQLSYSRVCLLPNNGAYFYGFILLCQIKFVKKFFDWLKIIQKQKVRLK